MLGVLNELKVSYKIIEITYNFFSFFPNFLIQLFSYNIHINERLKDIFNEPQPSLLIACGRRTAPISLKIHKIFNKKPFLVHLMLPRYTFFIKNFDIIFTPQHDSIKEKKNIIKILGTPNNISYLSKNNSHAKTPRNSSNLTLLIGGDHSRYKLSVDIIKKILNLIREKIKPKYLLQISTSRRTSKRVIEYLENHAKKDFLFIKKIYHPFELNRKKNPIEHFLTNCSEVIVTGDSMSMISEVCSINKPIRLFYNSEFCSKKHILFCEKMIKEGYAFPIETLGEKSRSIKTLNASELIANKIKFEFLNTYGRNLY